MLSTVPEIKLVFRKSPRLSYQIILWKHEHQTDFVIKSKTGGFLLTLPRYASEMYSSVHMAGQEIFVHRGAANLILHGGRYLMNES